MRGQFDPEFIERLRQESDLVQVISEYVPLKRKGNNYWGCCPFHNEKTPSFSVSPNKGMFYCFGCQTGGDIFHFLMKIRNAGFQETVVELAEKLHIPLPQEEKSPAQLREEQLRKQLLRVHEIATAFFRQSLLAPKGRSALTYLRSRGLSEELIEKFGLGYAPDSWEDLVQVCEKQGMRPELLEQAGLAASRTQGGGVYDRFRNRIMFPITNPRGQVVGFGGRVMDESMPKYLNSPETLLFNKRKVLFALSHAQSQMRNLEQVVVVEGYMDAITLHGAGFEHVVGSLGTAFTEEQARLISRQAREVIFAYDSDQAGRNATERAVEIAAAQGLRVRVLRMSGHKDPDEFLRQEGASAFAELLNTAPGIIEYQLGEALQEGNGSTPQGKAAAAQRVIPWILRLRNAIEQDEYCRRIAGALQIEESVFRRELERSRRQKDKSRSLPEFGKKVLPAAKSVDKQHTAARYLLRCMAEDPACRPYITAQLTAEDFVQESCRELFSLLSRENCAGASVLMQELSEQTRNEFSRILMQEEPAGDMTQLVDDCIKTLRLAALQREYEAHCRRADEYYRVGDKKFQQELEESKRINDEIRLLRDV